MSLGHALLDFYLHPKGLLCGIPLLPLWDLNLIILVLQKHPFESIGDIPLLALSQKVAFLVGCTPVWRVSELVA